MAASDEGDVGETCLGIAVDHRIKTLFKPVYRRPSGEEGDHINILQTGGHWLGRPVAELQVTAELAGPETIGGIAVSLQQPREWHPFNMGTDAVIEDCDTLSALGELFNVASCGTLELKRDVSVIDILPYVSEAEMGCLDSECLKKVFDTSLNAFCAKQPDVVLCMGKLGKEMWRYKGEAWKLENIGVGCVFHDQYRVVSIKGSDNRRVPIRRVNSFHPSYSLNYNCEDSCLRQLQMLEVAQVCGVYRGDWKEEIWMGRLRERCRRRPKTRPEEMNLPYLPYLADLYHSKLVGIRDAVLRICKSRSTPTPFHLASSQFCEDLAESGLSELCNDANLILHSIQDHVESDFDWSDPWPAEVRALQDINETTEWFAHTLWTYGNRSGCSALREAIQAGIDTLQCWSLEYFPDVLELDWDAASEIFLEMAVGVEDILGNLYQTRGSSSRTLREEANHSYWIDL